MFSKILKILLYVKEYLSDFVQVIKYNSYSPFEEKQKRLFYRIIINAHAIEKGLSLESPRTLFGQQKIKDLIQLIKTYDPSVYGVMPLEMTYGALQYYLEMHEKRGVKDSFLESVKKWQDEVSGISEIKGTGGAKFVDNNLSGSKLSYSEFIGSRFSCRTYQNKRVSVDLVTETIGLAQSAPSQCNRQSVRIHCYQDKGKILDLLTLQGGSAGFIDSITNLFVLTSEQTAWGGAGQRNQAYVDGALFSMALMLACQAYGIATCPLNLAVTNKKESEIKIVGKIHKRERLIMMIAFGYPLEKNLKAACSPRLPTDDMLTIHSFNQYE